MNRPNCFHCVHRRPVPGDAHSECVHPKTQNTGDMFLGIAAMLGRIKADEAPLGARELGITAEPHGIRMGWFCWPYNFDPTWLRTCNGFEPLDSTPQAVEGT